MKSKFILFLLVISALLTIQSVNAQSATDVIYLKNGSIIKGKVIENNGESTKIQTSDGREYIFKNSEIEQTTVIGENSTKSSETIDTKPLMNTVSNKRKYTPVKRGFWSSNDFQLWAPLSLNTVNGYKFHRFGYLGIGLGLNNYTGLVLSSFSFSDFSGIILPIYLRYGGDILNRRVTPTYFVEGGYGIVVSDAPIAFYNDPSSKKTGGVYAGAGFGFKVRTNKNLSFGVSLAYKFQHSQTINNYASFDNVGNPISVTDTYKYDMHRMGLKVIFIGFN